MILLQSILTLVEHCEVCSIQKYLCLQIDTIPYTCSWTNINDKILEHFKDRLLSRNEVLLVYGECILLIYHLKCITTTTK